MPKVSAGLLLYRRRGGKVEVFLVHPGGPLWAKKDLAAWSIPKGEVDGDEDLFACARREFAEETGISVAGEGVPLGCARTSSNKVTHVWAIEADVEPEKIVSNRFTLEWPPKSGRTEEFPEIDRAAWFSFATAAEKIYRGQAEFLTRLAAQLSPDRPAGSAPPGAA